jgi:hypothetical protein
VTGHRSINLRPCRSRCRNTTKRSPRDLEIRFGDIIPEKPGRVSSTTADPVAIADVGRQIETEIEAALLRSMPPFSIDSKVTKH